MPTRMDKILTAWLKLYPNGTKSEFQEYWNALIVLTDVRSL